MIVLAGEGDRSVLAALSENNPVTGARLGTDLLAYGLSAPFCRFYLLKKEDAVTGAFCVLDGICTFVLGEGGEPGEAAAFVQMDPLTHTVHADRGDFPLPGEPVARPVMELLRPEGLPDVSGLDIRNDFRACWQVGESCEWENFVPPRFDAWYADFSHKARRGLAECAVIFQGETPVSCAAVTAKTPQNAFLGWVFTRPESRGQGLAGRAVSALAGKLKGDGRHCLISPVSPSAEKIYEKIGFQRRDFVYTWNLR